LLRIFLFDSYYSFAKTLNSRQYLSFLSIEFQNRLSLVSEFQIMDLLDRVAESGAVAPSLRPLEALTDS